METVVDKIIVVMKIFLEYPLGRPYSGQIRKLFRAPVTQTVVR